MKALAALGVAAALVGTSQVALAAAILESEPNNSALTAQVITGSFFDVFFDLNIGDVNGANTSTTIPHVTVSGSGDGTFDWYTFVTSTAGIIILDIDFGFIPLAGGGLAAGSIDTQLGLWDVNGILLAFNDDFSTVAGAGGSVHVFDSFIQTGPLAAGQYFVGVCQFLCGGADNFLIQGSTPDPGATYTLQISANANAVPEPGSLALLGLGLAGFGVARRAAKK